MFSRGKRRDWYDLVSARAKNFLRPVFRLPRRETEPPPYVLHCSRRRLIEKFAPIAAGLSGIGS